MYNYVYDRKTGDVHNVTEAPIEYNYLLTLRKDNGGWYAVGITDYNLGIHLWDMVSPDEAGSFEQANVASDLCHRLGFIMERPACYAFAFTKNDINMFIV